MVNLYKRNGHEENTSNASDMARDTARDTARVIGRLIEMPRAEFEGLIVDLYRALGHQAKRAELPGERNFDIVVVSKTGQHWIVQCKQWRGAVGESVVREFYAAIGREHAAQGAIITTAKFTPKAREWAQGKPIHLYDGPALVQALQRIKGAGVETLLNSIA